MYSVLEKTQQETAVPAVNPSVPVKKESGFLVVESQVAQQALTRTLVAQTKKEPSFLGMKHGHLAIAALSMAVVDTIVRNPTLIPVAAVSMAMRLAYPQLKKGKSGKFKLHLATLSGLALSTTAGINLYALPAQAIFFQQAETFLSNTFDLSQGAVSVIFNVFRAIYVGT